LNNLHAPADFPRPTAKSAHPQAVESARHRRAGVPHDCIREERSVSQTQLFARVIVCVGIHVIGDYTPPPPGHELIGEGCRVFDVYCNGQVLLKNVDLFQEAAGQNRALDKIFYHIRSNAHDKIVLTFVPIRNYACVCAIEILQE
jgi:hypothetical protein